MSDTVKEIPKGTLTKEETIVYLMEIDKRFCIEPCVMRNAIYSACHYLDEELELAATASELELISRDKLLKDASNTITENSESMDWFNLIYNQPQVQPIVRSVEEIADTFLNITDCDLCIIKSKCNTKNGELVGRKTCKKMWIDWLTGKEV